MRGLGRWSISEDYSFRPLFLWEQKNKVEDYNSCFYGNAIVGPVRSDRYEHGRSRGTRAGRLGRLRSLVTMIGEGPMSTPLAVTNARHAPRNHSVMRN